MPVKFLDAVNWMTLWCCPGAFNVHQSNNSGNIYPIWQVLLSMSAHLSMLAVMLMIVRIGYTIMHVSYATMHGAILLELKDAWAEGDGERVFSMLETYDASF